MNDGPGVTKEEIRDVSEVLRYLLSVSPKTEPEFEKVRFDPERLLSYVVADGLIVRDVNEPGTNHRLSRHLIQKELTQSKGVSFNYLALLAYEVRGLDVKAIRLDQKTRATWTLAVRERYVLGFAKEGTRLRLATIFYMAPDGD
jgi:hypothetical protein